MTSLMDPNARNQNPLFQAIDAQNKPIGLGPETGEERRVAAETANRDKAGWPERTEQTEDHDAGSGLGREEDEEDLNEEDATRVNLDSRPVPVSVPETERPSKKRKTETTALDTGFMQLADHFQRNNILLAQHLEELRKGDRKFWQDLLTLERERIAVERDSFTAIAAAIVGHLTGLSSSQAPPAGAFNTGNRPQGRQEQAWDQSSIAREPQRRQ